MVVDDDDGVAADVEEEGCRMVAAHDVVEMFLPDDGVFTVDEEWVAVFACIRRVAIGIDRVE